MTPGDERVGQADLIGDVAANRDFILCQREERAVMWAGDGY
jgi:hypothetical protein